jgi:hypothetical protein
MCKGREKNTHNEKKCAESPKYNPQRDKGDASGFSVKKGAKPDNGEPLRSEQKGKSAN